MLRVRPLVHTPDPVAAAGFLQALGLRRAEDPAANGAYAVFDAGSGRVAVHGCEPGAPKEGVTALAFDVSDVREFARRTTEAGTAVELSEEEYGLAARITAPDGTSFLAGIGPRETGAPSSPLAVLAFWSTPDVGPVGRVLADMGARPRTGATAGARHDFSAKNGGLVGVRAAERPVVALAFEYDGDVRELVGGLAAAGVEAAVRDGGSSRFLRVHSPWGAEICVTERQHDAEGYRQQGYRGTGSSDRAVTGR